MKSFGAECTFEEAVKKQNVKKMNVNPFYNEIRMNHLM
jgi:hypothetical protein